MKLLFLKVLFCIAIVPTSLSSMNGKNMNILCITHADFETPGVIKDWTEQRSYQFTECKPYAGQNCLIQDNFDLLIIMGGPQDGKDAHKIPYLSDEVELIKRAIAQNKIVIGFCLGAQLIGEALGAQTEKSPEKEIGVYPVFAVENVLHDPILQQLGQTFSAIHWHNDMPGITEDSAILAYSDGCPRQIIKYLPRVYGFQCHLEITKQGIEDMIAACPQDLRSGRFIQSSQELLGQDYQAINNAMFKVLDAVVSL